MASYFKHLEKFRDLFAVTGQESKTYFTQVIKDVNGFDDLVKDYAMNDEGLLTEQLFDIFDNNITRRNEILNHLMGRFAERFGDYAFLMKDLYGSVTDEIVLKNKEDLLSEYDVIGYERSSAFNFYEQPPEQLWDTDNVSGFQKRVARLTGIKDYIRRSLSDSFVDIYPQVNAGVTTFRWRIKNHQQQIVLSATDDYANTALASRELHFAVSQVIQTKEEVVQQVFATPLADNQIVGNFKIDISVGGLYSFSVVNPDLAGTSPDFIVAKQYKYYNTQTALQEAILSLIGFMKFGFSEEGMFLVEHILLRPDMTQNATGLFMPICTNNGEDLCHADPYSFRVSIILPGYTYRFANADFRAYVELVIKEELPAHILPKICWVGYRKGDFENQKAIFFNDINERLEQAKQELFTQIDALQQIDSRTPEQEAALKNWQSQWAEVQYVFEKQRMEFLLQIVKQREDYHAIHRIETQKYDIQLADILAQKEVAIAGINTFTYQPEVYQFKLAEIQIAYFDKMALHTQDFVTYLEPFAFLVSDLEFFEDKYKAYLLKRTSSGFIQPETELKSLLEAIDRLNTIYPVGRLIDCDNESDELEGKIILGQTNIGTL